MRGGDAALKRRLDELRTRYETPEALALDPLALPLGFPEPLDRELAAWVAAHLAYGRVAPMLRAIQRILEPLGPSPSAWLRAAGAPELRSLEQALAPWTWRFHVGADLVAWLRAWRDLDRESGHGLEAHLAPGSGEAPDDALSRLVQRLRVQLPPSRGLRFSLPDPREGSACKRWRMFLRWMVRTGWPDLGLWKALPASGLVIPLDTHVARVSQLIGLTGLRTPDGRMAREITAALARLAPEDPLRYDFALSHLGILGDCPGVRTLPHCRDCPLEPVCGGGKTGRSSLREGS